MKRKTKEKMENVLMPLARAIDIDPNLLTLLSIAATLASAYYVLKAELATASLLFVAGAFLDVLDGLVARVHNRTTKLGSFADKTADRINDGVILIAVMLAGYVSLLVGVLALFFVLLASYMSAVLDSLTGKRIGEMISFRPVRAAVIFLGLLAAQVTAMVWVLLFIGIWACLYRFFKAVWILTGHYVILK
jgi:archaetidylinositol phosphate synthase